MLHNGTERNCYFQHAYNFLEPQYYMVCVNCGDPHFCGNQNHLMHIGPRLLQGDYRVIEYRERLDDATQDAILVLAG